MRVVIKRWVCSGVVLGLKAVAEMGGLGQERHAAIYRRHVAVLGFVC
jgi:hypothetical protein